MKKFLTVLLALSVVFTYSFSAVGSAFAATTDDTAKATALAEAKAYAEGIVNLYYDAAMEIAVDDCGFTLEKDEADIDAAWAKVDVKGKLAADINKNYVAEANEFAKYVEGLSKEQYAAKVFGISATKENGEAVHVDQTLAAKIDAVVSYEPLKNIYEAYIGEILSALDKVDYTLYSDTEKNDDGITYLEAAKNKIAAAKEEAEKLYYPNEKYEKEDFVSDLMKYAVPGAENLVKANVKALTYEGTDVPNGFYAVVGIDTITDLENDDIVNDATIAAAKAAIQKVYADYMTDKTIAVKDKAYADAYVTIYNFLAEKGFVKAKDFETQVLKNYEVSHGKDMKKAVSDVEDLVAFAAKYKAEKDAAGNFVRDAEAVDKLVNKAKLYTYAKAVDFVNSKIETYTIDNAERDIKAMSVKVDAQKLAFAKAAAKAALDNEKADIIDDYYALEAAKVEANYAAAVDKIEKATELNRDETLKVTLPVLTEEKGKTIPTKKAVRKNIVDNFFKSGEAAQAAFLAVDAYVDYVNTGKTILDAGYIFNDAAKIKEEIANVYGEAGARTSAEMKAVEIKAEDIAAKLATVGGIAAAKKAAEDAIKALPAKVTEADKDAVKAAWELAEAYKELTNAPLSNQATLDKAIDALYTDMANNFKIAVAKADKKDLAQMKELKASFDAANKLVGADKLFDKNLSGVSYPKFEDKKVTDALEAIREAELKNVDRLIAALPVNVTLADKAQIEAARKAYDAFVEEWTSYDPAYNAAAQVADYKELALAEAALSILEKDAAIKATEALKLSVSTKLYKKSNKIRVNWKVKDGDASYIDGYQVYKSTKAQKNYKFMGKTKKSYMDNKKNLKKGTRYFYKVRAYVEIDGQKYYSDWSNKGNRIYK